MVFWFEHIFLIEFQIRIHVFDKMLLPDKHVSFEGLYYSRLLIYSFCSDVSISDMKIIKKKVKRVSSQRTKMMCFIKYINTHSQLPDIIRIRTVNSMLRY